MHEGLGTPAGKATLYLDAAPQGTSTGIGEAFSWDMATATIRLGVNYVGLWDELAVFDRALTADEVESLHGLERRRGGAAVSGRVARIFLRPSARTPVKEVAEAVAYPGAGLEGDHAGGGNRQVTLLSAASWRDACAALGQPDLSPGLRRANVIVEGVDLHAAIGQTLHLGACRIDVIGETRPCRLMDDAAPGLQDALDPACRGGVYGRVRPRRTPRGGRRRPNRTATAGPRPSQARNAPMRIVCATALLAGLLCLRRPRRDLRLRK